MKIPCMRILVNLSNESSDAFCAVNVRALKKCKISQKVLKSVRNNNHWV